MCKASHKSSDKFPLNLLRIISYFVMKILSPLGLAKEISHSLFFCSMNIFVARLNFKTKREDLEAAFAKFGQVTSAKIVKDRDTGRSKGFGFVEMANDEEANKAIAALNETELDGRAIVVKPANPKAPAEGG
jgi:RNA recognition motif-containing protein